MKTLLAIPLRAPDLKAAETAGQQGGVALKALLAISLKAFRTESLQAFRPTASRMKKLEDGNEDSS